MSDSTPTPGDATSIEAFVRSDLFRAILRTQHADLLSASTTAAATVPTGAVVPYAIETAPDGWLLCNGQDVYKDAYPALFAVLGTKYGTPTDTLKFKLPDLQGRVPVGYGTGYTTLNNPGGAATVTLSTDQIPSHSHGTDGGNTGYADPSHSHTMQAAGGDHNHGVWAVSGATSPPNYDGLLYAYRADRGPYYTGSTVNHSHTIDTASINHRHSIDSTGGGQSHSNMQPYIVLNYIIRT